MIEELKIWSQIEAYFSDNMGKEEREAFEKAISSDTELADMVESYKLTENVAVVHEALKLKAQMNSDMADSKGGRTSFWIIGTVGLGIGLGAYLMYTSSKSEQKEIVKETTGKVDALILAKKQEKNISLEIKPEGKIKLTASKQKSSKEEQITATNYLAETKQAVEPTIPSFANEQKMEKKTVSQIDPCVGLEIDLDFYTLPNCKGQNTGEIHVKPETVKGGVAPYSYSLSPDREFKSSVLKEKGAGNYQLFVKDGNACIAAVAKPVVIGSINCKEVSKDFTYSPLHDPAWVIPYDPDKSARSIKIISKGGKEVFYSSVSSGNPTEWNGESNTGSFIETGYYLYFIEYSDGTLDKGAISILR